VAAIFPQFVHSDTFNALKNRKNRPLIIPPEHDPEILRDTVLDEEHLHIIVQKRKSVSGAYLWLIFPAQVVLTKSFFCSTSCPFLPHIESICRSQSPLSLSHPFTQCPCISLHWLVALLARYSCLTATLSHCGFTSCSPHSLPSCPHAISILVARHTSLLRTRSSTHLLPCHHIHLRLSRTLYPCGPLLTFCSLLCHLTSERELTVQMTKPALSSSGDQWSLWISVRWQLILVTEGIRELKFNKSELGQC